MNRLTKRNSEGVAVYKQPYQCERCGEEICRLPDYGDGSPTDKLITYEDAEEQGLMLRLPCRLGDVVFALWSIPSDEKYVIYQAEIKEIRIGVYMGRKTIKYYLEPVHYSGRYRIYYLDDFGKMVFFTKAEAEEALREMKGDSRVKP